MSTAERPIAGDRARVSVSVAVPQAAAFRIFSEDLDQWWRRGRKYRVFDGRRGMLHLEPRVGGRLFESVENEGQTTVIETGLVKVWEPPQRLAFEWRAVNFVGDEFTYVEVTFAPTASGTLVTVTHSGFSRLRPDHPARHGRKEAEFVREMGMWWGGLMTSLREHCQTHPAAREAEQP
jgi:uncharacterized protein YndB with AHSA1/START domain